MYPPTQSLEFWTTKASMRRSRMASRTASHRRRNSAKDTALTARPGVAVVIDARITRSMRHNVQHGSGGSGQIMAQIVAHDAIGLIEIHIAHAADQRRD